MPQCHHSTKPIASRTAAFALPERQLFRTELGPLPRVVQIGIATSTMSIHFSCISLLNATVDKKLSQPPFAVGETGIKVHHPVGDRSSEHLRIERSQALRPMR